MSNYLISRNNTIEHFFYTPTAGICKKTFNHNRWCNQQTIYKEGIDGFCVYIDSNNTLNLICSNKSGDLILLIEKENNYHKYVLIRANNKIYPQTIRVYPSNNRSNLLYSAKYNDETLLICCILGLNSKPFQMDTLSSEYSEFFLYDNKVYYTNNSNTLGFRDFSAGKPDTFIPICENSYMPYIFNDNDGDKLVYIKNDTIMCNETPLFVDKQASNPIICNDSKKLLLVWKSSNFIKYSSSSDNGVTWNSPMRFVTSANSTHLYNIQQNEHFFSYYGTLTQNELNLIGAHHFFTQKISENSSNKNYDNYNELKSTINSLKQELYLIKEQITTLQNFFLTRITDKYKKFSNIMVVLQLII